jgi:hypothetical protein
MQFVVWASDRTGTRWLSVPNAGGIRMLGPRWMAAVFETEAEARMAMAKCAEMLEDLGKSDIVFTIEQIC